MSQIGIVGLGVMGAALAMNFAQHGHEVHGFDLDPEGRKRLADRAAREGLRGNIHGHDDLAAAIGALERPRAILVMVPDRAVDAVTESLRPHLADGDIVIDGGNTNFADTQLREKALRAHGLHWVGMGVSGGEHGARHGPSMMVGGTEHAWDRIGPMILSVAADYHGTPCAARVGPDGSGHFVKTVHNGIEYADMQLIAEVYGLCRDGLGQDAGEIGAMFAEWNERRLRSYLVEITATVLTTADPETGRPLPDVILDSAGQKGTGRWTVIEALKLGQSATAIEAAVAARGISAETAFRRAGAERLDPGGAGDLSLDPADLASAFLAGRIVAYAQGLALLDDASRHFEWDIDLARVAEIWRAGCIIRSALLDDIASAVRQGLPEERLILAPHFRDLLAESVPALRRVVAAATGAGLPIPAFSAALAYYDAARQSRGTANLIQAQRDFFGRHGFRRVDREGEGLHGPWAG